MNDIAVLCKLNYLTIPKFPGTAPVSCSLLELKNLACPQANRPITFWTCKNAAAPGHTAHIMQRTASLFCEILPAV